MANSPNDASKIEQSIANYPVWVHPDVRYMASEWELLRDCDLGEKQVKAKGQDYLPRLESFTDDDYIAYLDRGVFYNMVARTKGGMVGSIFRRLPNISNLPDKLNLDNVGQEGEDFRTFAKTVAQEVIHMGRCGVLLDRSSVSTKQESTTPYLALYIAESILSWQTQMIAGRKQLTKVVLREIVEDQDPDTGYTRFLNQYRVLRLAQDDIGKWTYIQELYMPSRTVAAGVNAGGPLGVEPGTLKSKGGRRRKTTINGDFNADSDGQSTGSSAGDANIFGEPDEVTIPTIRGVSFDFIPFIIFGPQTCNADVEKSPLLDIARLNLSHYRSYAHLEHGRFYTGLPVYWAQVDQNDSGGEWTIGPSVVWEIPIGGKAGIIEFNGNGLKFLADALTEKESQVAALGGRLIGTAGRSVSESDNQVQLKDRNEQALLLSCTLALDSGFTRIMQWYCNWIDISLDEADKLQIEFNKDFLFSPVSAREFRAIEAMYKDGVLPIEVLFDYFKRAEVVPDWLDIDEFKGLLKSAASFPDQPDFDSREAGYPDSSAQIISEDKEKDRELALQLADKTAKAALDATKHTSGVQKEIAVAGHETQKAVVDVTTQSAQKIAKDNAANQKAIADRANKVAMAGQKLQARNKPPAAAGSASPQTRQAKAHRNQTLQRRETKSTSGR